MRGEKRDQLRESGEKNQHKVTKKKKKITHTLREEDRKRNVQVSVRGTEQDRGKLGRDN